MSRSSGALPAIAHRLARVAVLNSPDADLLRRFVESRDEAAFEAIVVRHGPMVFDVCRGILPGWADSEDAFQATFLVLARRAAVLRDPDTLARWLFGVARRTARKARATSLRRRRREAAAPPPQPPQPVDPSWSEVQTIVRDEVSRVAERYRLPLALCYLDGRTQAAAALLGLSKGTLRRRLERGRAILRERLVRRGLGPTAVLIAAAWPLSTLAGAVPPGLVRTTAAAAIKFATGDSSAVSSTVSSLTHGVMSAMYLTKLTSTVVTAALLLAAVAAGAWIFEARAKDDPIPRPTGTPYPSAPKENAAPDAPKGDRVQKDDEFREFTDTITAPVVYKDLMLVLVTKNGVAAVRFTKEIEGGVEYEFRYESADGKTQKSGTGKVTEKDAPVPKSDLFIEAGPIPLRWSYADDGKAWVYYNPSKVAVHLAKAADFKDREEPTPFDGPITIPELDLKKFLRK